jgi:hypothetical protein
METGLVRISHWLTALLAQWPGAIRQIIILAVLALSELMAPVAAAQAGVSPPLSLQISVIGTTIVREGDRPAVSPSKRRGPPRPSADSKAEENGQRVYFVDFRAPIQFKVSGEFPFAGVPYVLVRKENDRHWNVQPTAKRIGTSEFLAEVEFGKSGDQGQHFEVQAVIAQGQLPRGELPESTLSRTILSFSRAVAVQRRHGPPIIAITRVGGTDIYDGVLPAVKLQTPVEIRSEGALPPAHAIGLAIQPVEPATDRRWIMFDVLKGESGHIVGHFGQEGMNDRYKFVLTAFVAPLEHFPPRAKGSSEGILADDWKNYSKWFLAESLPLRVVRWEGAFKILSIGRESIRGEYEPRETIKCAKRCEVRGAVPGSLRPHEKIWLLAYPNQNEPWVAAWTASLDDGGRWNVGLADFSPGVSSGSFKVIAVISSDDPVKRSPAGLNAWLQDQGQRTFPVTVTIRSDSLSGATRQEGLGK